MIQAVKDKLVIEMIKPSEVTEGGIVIPDTAQQKEPQLRGKVISVGNEVTEEIKPGQTIFCHERAGMDIMVNNVIYKVLADGEVYATYEGVK